MNNYEKYYWYDKIQDKVIECNWDEYSKLTKHMKEINSTVKCDKFSLRSGLCDFDSSCGLNDYRISTICLSTDHGFFEESEKDKYSCHAPVIFETMVFSGDNDYDGYEERYTCLAEAKKRHDEIVLKIVRGEKIK